MTTLEKPTTASPAPAPAPRRAIAPLRPHVIGAVFGRNFLGYFSNPAGYVFITLFVLVSSWVAFCQPAFFTNNLANLDTLNQSMPYLLLFFVPAITMSIWAEERRQGTDELLLTLPARDVEVVLGKYLAAVGIFTVALAFSLSHVVVLLCLGSPDPGVLASTYLGYWLMGSLLIAIGMVASMLSTNATVAFILGGVLAAIPVFAGQVGALLESVPAFSSLVGSSTGSGVRRMVEAISVPSQFRDFGQGVVPISGVLYFLTLSAAMLYLNMLLIGRRHWAGGQGSGGRWAHAMVRVACLVIALIGLDTIVARAGWRMDWSAEGLNTLSAESRKLIAEIPKDRPVYIQAYVSPEVPREYVETRTDLVNLLKEYAAIGGERIRLNIVETTPFGDAAGEAEKRFGITARPVQTADRGKISAQEIYLGVAFSSGTEEVVVPFFDRGLPVEYELTRSIRVASLGSRKKVGILQTDVRMLGGFDFRSASMGQNEEWQVVTELKKQYDVRSVGLETDLPNDLDCLVVAQPSSLTQPQIDKLTAYVRKGKATLLLMDPYPYVDPSIAPEEPKRPPGGMFGGSPPPEQKGDLQPLLELIGLDWPTTEIIWNRYNPLKQFEQEPELVFIDKASGAPDAFGEDPATSGLQEVVAIFAGHFRQKGGSGPAFEPLLKTNEMGGIIDYSELSRRGPFGGGSINPDRAHIPSGRGYTLAARIKGVLKPEAPAKDPKAKDAKAPEPKGVEAKVIAIADIDLISDLFFNIRKRPSENLDALDFDNVNFVLNCVDELSGDDAFIALRKRRPRHRPLEALEAQSRKYVQRAADDSRKAEDEAKDALAKAQKALDEKVEKVRANKDMDEQSKRIALETLQIVETRKLEVAKERIDADKKKAIGESRNQKDRAIEAIQDRIKALALALPPLPALFLAGIFFGVRLGKENRGASPNRLA